MSDQHRYLGEKEILAVPMLRGEYNQYRGWDNPDDENPADEGYLVEYLDSPNSVHPNHDNYISWSPKDVFERAYRPAGTAKERVEIELEQLVLKVVALQGFLGANERPDGFHPAQENLLRAQLGCMVEYGQILEARLELM